ncbi:MAG: winged helix-turn-helix transcriptional regulator [Lentisphaeria bacterium]|nr:winged helix-turn-helix transcriptional regulator [Lentisphaeria bacterium]
METLSKETALWKKLFQTTEKIRNYQSRAISKGKAPDITMTQVQIIGCVLFSPEQSVRVRDISEELGITPGGISQQVENLVKMGLLERKTDEKDRRAVCITLSEKGKEINQWLDGFLSGLFQKLLSEVPEEKRKIFVEVLDVMYQGMCHIQ